MPASPQQRTTVDLKALSLQQLAEIKQQLDQEIEHLSESFQKLRQAQAKFEECIVTVKKTSDSANEGKDILVPLTSSLYIPGKTTEIDTFMVDVGTGYYVEKDSKSTILFFTNKVNTLKKNLIDLETVVQGKSQNLRAVEEILQEKMQANQANAPQ
ncbi:Prefoldin alpha subunit [Nadsonia fulvescens var. elongata DSM 6958]|uniref:Prefoldin alpha subunit n=1 Tax=Nadsonia fulvescens var. elongata DSM 6958 TaxID=857566 RepID=A0A1E3PSM9_9ASCO|nr:Prefoldin alpha subunit [Nadsonia fulvescens var. elongata DSM 6958]